MGDFLIPVAAHGIAPAFALEIRGKSLIFVPMDNLTTAQFEEVVIKASEQRPVLVDFWATWCQPCLMLSPILEKLAEEYAGHLTMVKVDIDKEPQLAATFGIRSVPTVMLFSKGKIATQFSGVLPPDGIRHLLEPHLPRPSDALIEQARTLLRDSGAAQACNLLKKALTQDPENYRIHPELGVALLHTGALEELEDLLRNLPPNIAQDDAFRLLHAQLSFARVAEGAPEVPELEQMLAMDENNLDARFALAARKVVAGEYEPAMENLLAIIRQDRRYRDDCGRRALVDVFALLNNEGPLVRKYRGLLAGAIH
jgi:putative thioredoxin